jgi:hypothetical protein
MMGTISLNLIIGAISFVITFIVSSFTNIWMTTLIRSCYSFIILFLLVFLFRWVLGTFAGLDKTTNVTDENKGTALDLTTPDEDAALNQMLKDSLDPNATETEPGFAPLNPPKLSSKVNMESEELAQALRHISEE